MIMEMEIAYAERARAELPVNRTTVGFHIEVKHVAPAKPGAAITTTARLVSIEGRKLTFRGETRDVERLVGIGRHRREIVGIDNLA